MTIHDRREFLKRLSLATGGAALGGFIPSSLLRSAPLAPRCGIPRNRPFNVVAIGDSIVWGQGLDEASKFTVRVRDWLQGQLQLPVTLTSFAHSGAIIEPHGTGDAMAPYAGEVPNSWPSIKAQARMAAGLWSGYPRGNITAPPADEIDLVIVDGGINDVGVTNIIDPRATSLVPTTQAKCDYAMRSLLSDVAMLFPNARVVVTGYFAIVSQESNINDVVLLMLAGGVVATPFAPLPGLALQAAALAELVAEFGGEGPLKTALATRSATFHQTATTSLRSAVNAVNSTFKRDFRFAEPGFGPRNSYAAPESWLWHLSAASGIAVSDPARETRRLACEARYGSLDPDLTPGASFTDRPKCPLAAMGHPTQRGAQAYADAITRELSTLLPAC